MLESTAHNTNKSVTPMFETHFM